MAIQIVMDPTGDTRYEFDPQDTGELAEAEQRFKKLISQGFTAATRTSQNTSVKLVSFDPRAEEIVFFPRLVAG